MSASPRLQRLQDLFHQAAELPAEEQAAFLDRACADDPGMRAEVADLLDRDRSDDDDATIAARVLPLARALADDDPSQRSGERIGGYRLVREIGSGGMGSVFLAHREDRDFQHQVAIKLVRGFPTSQVLDGFRRERELLATLRHPNIARLFDGGSTEAGQPFLVMEYVDGVPLDDWCAQQRPSLAERLRLFQSLCSAVQHAHQQLIVHRDLKPANVLVRADGQPVLLDFGIGKLLDQDEDAREATVLRAMTPAYASPEQLRGDVVTTLSDIYALGLILFELLAGVPLRKQEGDTTRLVASQVAAGGEAWLRDEARLLRGDLDNIVRKALREEPERRYQTAAALAADIQAWFDRRPVSAAPDDWRYRVRKFIARHPLAIGATVATIAVLAVLSVRLAAERDRALEAQAQARIEAEGANQQAEFLVDLFKLASPENVRGRELGIRDLVDGARDELADRQFGRAEVKARLEVALGEIYGSLGVPETGLALLEGAVARLRGADDAVDGRVLARALLQTGRLLAGSNRSRSAQPMLVEALELNRALQPPGHASIGHSLMSLGVAEQQLGQRESALARFREAETVFAALGEDYLGNRAAALHNIGWATGLDGDHLAAVALLEQSLAIKRQTYGALHPSTFNTLQVLARNESTLGRDEAAIARLQELLAAERSTLGEDSIRVGRSLNELASAHHDAGHQELAERHYREAIAHHERHGQARVLELVVPVNNLGTLFEDSERHAEAEALFRRSLQLREQFAEDEAAIARARHNLARLLLNTGQAGRAAELVEAALPVRQRLLRPGHAERIDGLILKARIDSARGRPEQAREALAAIDAELAGAAAPAALAARRAEAAAELAHAHGDLGEAIGQRRRQLELLQAAPRPQAGHIARAQLALAGLLVQADDPAGARALVEQAGPVAEQRLAADGPSRRQLQRLRTQLALSRS